MGDVIKELWAGTKAYSIPIAMIIIALGMFLSAIFNNMYVQDNPVEEIVEMEILEESGLNIDLSPQTKEK